MYKVKLSHYLTDNSEWTEKLKKSFHINTTVLAKHYKMQASYSEAFATHRHTFL